MNVTALKTLLFVACLLPLARLAAELLGVGGLSLGANPVERLLHQLGWWGLVLLLVTLTVTPAMRLAQLAMLARFRRMLGLFAFTYIALHFSVYAWLDQGLSLAAIGEDILKRPYITLGVIALLLLIPLAITSTDAMRRRLGRRWKRLHRSVYPIAILGVWHFYWQVKQDLAEPLIFAAVLAVLLGYRVWYYRRRSTRVARA